jgi:hypothetical protein
MLRGEWNLFIENITESEIGQYSCKLIRNSQNGIIKLESKKAELILMG